MPMPETLHEMLRAGYVRLNDGTCKGCGMPIAWFKTTKGGRLPVDLPLADNGVRTVPHFSTCPNAGDFKGPKRRAADTAAQRTEAVQKLLHDSGARVVVALYPEGAISAWIRDLSGEEIRHELITAANQVRWNINCPLDKGVSS